MSDAITLAAKKAPPSSGGPLSVQDTTQRVRSCPWLLPSCPAPDAVSAASLPERLRFFSGTAHTVRPGVAGPSGCSSPRLPPLTLENHEDDVLVLRKQRGSE